MIVAITGVIIFCVTVASKSVLLGTFGIWAVLILPVLAILAIVLAAQSQKHIKRSHGTLTGSRWASAGLIAGVLLSLVALQAMISLPAYIAYTRRGYDADVKTSLKNAAKAEETYYKDNGTYTANVGKLKGFTQGDNVTISASATATTFVFTGTVKAGCGPKTGTWTFNSTTGAIDGTPCF